MHFTEQWHFPLRRTHTGMLLGNGVMGVMIWGADNVLRVTLNRGDFWDHRGGKPWVEGMSYTNIRHLLEAGDETGLRALFEEGESTPGVPRRPSLLPLGRIELVLASEMHLTTGTLDMRTGQVAVCAEGPSGPQIFTLSLSMDAPVLHIAFSDHVAPGSIIVKRVTSWDYVGEYLREISFEEPQYFDSDALSGWVQSRPVDPPLCVGYRVDDANLWLTLSYGEDAAGAQANAYATLLPAITAGADAHHAATAVWWDTYWHDVPCLDLPNATLDFLYTYGMFKFAGLTHPEGIPAGLQGPWIEETNMPPWSGDYHFNINVQMCYWPAYRGNRLAHLMPLFEMIASWQPQLRQNARIFVDAPTFNGDVPFRNGVMLPHAVDDRCTCMGGFWTGSVDHGCTAWVSEMMYRYYIYSGDVDFLRETVYPFMLGAMRVYEAMLEREGDAWVLPVGVSPEYRGAAMNAWGRNASFQLACIHWLCEHLQKAATVLGEIPDPLWEDIRQNLPRAALIGSAGGEEIALWEETPLEESHRHHSHLAGIVPFDVLDPADEMWSAIYERSLRTWIKQGMGMWSGWCVPWAAMLHSRFDNGEMAELLLEIWDRVYTNEGHGTLHDCVFPGFTLIGTPAIVPAWRTFPQEKMQMDAGMGATAAILDMLLHTRRGVNYIFAGVPARWANVTFKGIRTEGAFLVSATRENGILREVRVYSESSGTFLLANSWKDAECPVLEFKMEAGQEIVITDVNRKGYIASQLETILA
ncbi:MAG: hypothetical protein JXA33_01035 [Anaerolineae bacterium]|nr:hypothetical protein [Anaerolineae bacterium]